MSKSEWAAVLTSTGIRNAYGTHEVVAVMALSREAGRYVYLDMTPTEARDFSRQLAQHADRVDELNERSGNKT